jgi:hypothetical protein
VRRHFSCTLFFLHLLPRALLRMYIGPLTFIDICTVRRERKKGIASGRAPPVCCAEYILYMQFTLSGNLFWMIEIEGAQRNKLLSSR